MMKPKISASVTEIYLYSDRFARRPVYSPFSKPAVKYTGLANIIAAPRE